VTSRFGRFFTQLEARVEAHVCIAFRLGGKTYATATLIHKLTFIFGLKPTWCRTD